MEFQNFTSLPPEQEQTFVVFEKTSVESGKKAMTIGVVAGAIFGICVIALVFSHDAPENAHAVKAPPTKVGEAKKKVKAPAPAPVEAAPAADPTVDPAAPADPAAAPADPAAAPEAAAAPAPAEGTTKAPPTALVGE